MSELVSYVRARFKGLADARKAREMAAYMKTDMPFYGVQKPQRVPVYREVRRLFAPKTQRDYANAVQSLWALPHREEKYTAIVYAQSFPEFITRASMPMYRRMIIGGAWWDFVDEIAIRLVGLVLLEDGSSIWPTIDVWIDHRDMWLRRSAIICQIKHKDQTDAARLFEFCLRRAHEQEFFIRKAIGWALRQYAYTDAAAVKRFIAQNRDTFSPLSVREGSKHL